MVSTWAGNCCACQDNTSLQKRRSTSIEMLLYGIRQRPIFPGRQCRPHHSQNDGCSRHAYLRSITAKKEAPRLRCFYMESGSDLSSRAVSSQVLSALKGLTAVFGMGTGGTPSSLPPEMVSYSLRRSLPLPDCRIVAPFRFPVKPLRSLRLPVPLALSCTLTTAHRMIQSQTVFQLVSALSFGCPKRPSAVIKPSTY